MEHPAAGIPLCLLLLLMTSTSSCFFSEASARINHGGGRQVLAPAAGQNSFPPVKLQIMDQYVVVGNGIVEVNLTNPGGSMTGIQYNGIDNLLEVVKSETDRGYWDVVWKGDGIIKKKGALDRLECKNLTVITEEEEQVELSFTRKWSSELQGKPVPLDIDKRFVMRRGSSGFYTYAIYEHSQQHPAFQLANTRLVLKPRKDKFHYMAISDKKQRPMPLPEDRVPPRGQPLAYPEAVLLVDPIEPQFKGEVDDKYEYSMESRDIKVHGWMGKDPSSSVGFWQITPSSEFRSAGPLKQFLSSHDGPTCLAVFHSTHYTGADLMVPFEAGEAWKKVYGPVFVYFNSLESEASSSSGTGMSLWDDAKNQLMVQAKQWPYRFLGSRDYPLPDQRGGITGRLSVHDPEISTRNLPPTGGWVGLAAPGDPGSWQLESKGYQFWTEVEEDGSFSISNVIAGQYNLYGWVPGFIGDYKYDAVINITPGRSIEVGDLVFEPPRNASTLWEIGVPDRTAGEFFIPDANPNYINKLYIHQEKKGDNGTYEGTTWQVKYSLDRTYQNVNYTLRIALATANGAELQVRVNDPSSAVPLFTTGSIGKDNTIARHGIHGVYRLFSVVVPGSLLVDGSNTVFLTQAINTGPFYGLMYDYIRLEGPLSPNPPRN
ncbi:unnamed protein product [Linum tenue]|uniref:rhamnogalacturonan endolyase n=1 Tax=Linum tenue TaxID=586396 RepID=A0AAV0P078_9ROSI|nr:unnamed protein product [Linum tenue]